MKPTTFVLLVFLGSSLLAGAGETTDTLSDDVMTRLQKEEEKIREDHQKAIEEVRKKVLAYLEARRELLDKADRVDEMMDVWDKIEQVKAEIPSVNSGSANDLVGSVWILHNSRVTHKDLLSFKEDGIVEWRWGAKTAKFKWEIVTPTKMEIRGVDGKVRLVIEITGRGEGTCTEPGVPGTHPIRHLRSLTPQELAKR